MKKIFFSILTTLYCTYPFAQEEEKKIDRYLDTKSSAWYASPWIWVAVAALIILLLVYLSSRKKD